MMVCKAVIAASVALRVRQYRPAQESASGRFTARRLNTRRGQAWRPSVSGSTSSAEASPVLNREVIVPAAAQLDARGDRGSRVHGETQRKCCSVPHSCVVREQAARRDGQEGRLLASVHAHSLRRAEDRDPACDVPPDPGRARDRSSPPAAAARPRRSIGQLAFDPLGADFTPWLNRFTNRSTATGSCPRPHSWGYRGTLTSSSLVERDGTPAQFRALDPRGSALDDEERHRAVSDPLSRRRRTPSRPACSGLAVRTMLQRASRSSQLLLQRGAGETTPVPSVARRSKGQSEREPAGVDKTTERSAQARRCNATKGGRGQPASVTAVFDPRGPTSAPGCNSSRRRSIVTGSCRRQP